MKYDKDIEAVRGAINQAHESPRLRAHLPGHRGDPSDFLIIALDLPTAHQTLELLASIGSRCRWVKIGMELFYAEGGHLVRELRKRGYRIFLDLKLHDIPNTVSSAIRSLDSLEIDLLSVHASGGPAMLKAASAAVALLEYPPRLAAVTVLTSMGDEQLREIGVNTTSAIQVLKLARMSVESGLNALVASPQELQRLREEFGPELLLIVPGVRLPGDSVDDQSRVATPREAIRRGASFLVIGRPITRANDPEKATEAILREISIGLTDRESG